MTGETSTIIVRACNKAKHTRAMENINKDVILGEATDEEIRSNEALHFMAFAKRDSNDYKYEESGNRSHRWLKAHGSMRY